MHQCTTQQMKTKKVHLMPTEFFAKWLLFSAVNGSMTLQAHQSLQLLPYLLTQASQNTAANCTLSTCQHPWTFWHTQFSPHSRGSARSDQACQSLVRLV